MAGPGSRVSLRSPPTTRPLPFQVLANSAFRARLDLALLLLHDVARV